MANDQIKYVIVTPVRDEAAHIRKTIASVAAQTLPPARWVIVDDGSSDGTGAIIDRHAERLDWLEAMHRENRGYRAAGGGVVEAFNAGYGRLGDLEWDFLVKLDGDLSFASDYFERCLAVFAREPALGIGGGTVCRLEQGACRVDSVGDPPFHVRGATKIYRRACWERIQPLIPAPGWDTVDEIMANQRGWTTRTFPELTIIQHKPTGNADGRWRNWFKNGRANYITGYHPLFMLAKCARRARLRPFLVESVALLAGYGSGYLTRLPRATAEETVRYLRRQQIRRLFLRPSIYG
jgi:poly-beta-1,6-N-acetyl-D-glucosamine synthase